MSEQTPVYPQPEKWQCVCGVQNDKTTHNCMSCGKLYGLSTYINPCIRCGLCGNLEQKLSCKYPVERY